MSGPEDESILAACRRGEISAFEQLVLRHQKAMYNVAYRISGNEADAAEIVQEAFLSAWRKIKEFRGDSKLSTWLISITVNQARTRWQQNRQKSSRETPLEIGDDDGRPPLQPASSEASPLELLEREQLGKILERCIKALDEAFREVMVLRDIREMAYDEVSAALGIREGTVKSRLFRAREAVRDCVTRSLRRP